MSNHHSTMSRRDFMKAAVIGTAGAAVAAGGTFTWAYQGGSSAFAHAGWENYQGHEYFDRESIEVDTVPESNWVEIGPDLGMPYSYGNRHRSPARHRFSYRQSENSMPESGFTSLDDPAIDPYWRNYYELYPMQVERDREYFYDWAPTARAFIDKHSEDRSKFNEGKGYLANIRASAHTAIKIESISDPPEVADWQRIGNVTSVRSTRAVFNSPQDAAIHIKRAAHDLGATLVRITSVHPEWFYLSHAGRGSRGYGGEEIIHPLPSWWKNVIVVTNTMNFDTMYADPNYGASHPGYHWTSTSVQKICDYIRRLGYAARWSSPRGGYDTFMVPNLVESGMGSVGRTSNGLGPDFGGDWRPGLIITDLPLAHDRPIDMHLDKFCLNCKLCAEVCPTDAISYGDELDYEIHGLRRWYTNHHKCRDGWRMVAGPAGCRACVAVCPASRKNTWVHRLVKDLIYRDPTGISQRIAVSAEKALFPKNMGDVLISPEHLGVCDPPEWLVTENYISGFTDTPFPPEVS